MASIPGMQPATAVAESKCTSSRTTTSPASANSASTACPWSAERAGHEQEHAETERRSDVGHDARHVSAGGQSLAQLGERDARGHRDQSPGAEQGSRLGEHPGDVLRPYRDDDDVGALDQLGERRGERRAGLCGGLRGGVGGHVQIRERRRIRERRPAPSLAERAGDVPGADEPDPHARESSGTGGAAAAPEARAQN